MPIVLEYWNACMHVHKMCMCVRVDVCCVPYAIFNMIDIYYCRIPTRVGIVDIVHSMLLQ